MVICFIEARQDPTLILCKQISNIENYEQFNHGNDQSVLLCAKCVIPTY